MSDSQKIIAVMGPTAAGKTGLAIELLERFPLEIISVDSALVYRRMNIGTAKPTAAELARAPHRLIDIREPWESYSAAEFVDDATLAIDEIRAAGKVPLLVGGTMLYFRALFHGLSSMPDADTGIRQQIDDEAHQQGWAAMHQQLTQIDPVAGARIMPGDRQRIQRALEVYRLTGKPISQLQAETARSGLDADCLKLVVSPVDRAVLHQRIERRFAQMLEQGFVDEVKTLKADNRVEADSAAMRSVGYRQVWNELENPQGDLLQRGIYATRQLAKRQLTWLRKEVDAVWLDPTDADWIETAAARIGDFLTESLC